MPMTPFMGVWISWLMRSRGTCSSRAVAASASSFARTSSRGALADALLQPLVSARRAWVRQREGAAPRPTTPRAASPCGNHQVS